MREELGTNNLSAKTGCLYEHLKKGHEKPLAEMVRHKNERKNLIPLTVKMQEKKKSTDTGIAHSRSHAG